MTTNFRPSTLPDLPADLRAVAKALAARLAAIGYNDDARTLKGASKCWTAARAAKTAAGTLYLSHPSLEADLARFVECAHGASMKAAQAVRVAL